MKPAIVTVAKTTEHNKLYDKGEQCRLSNNYSEALKYYRQAAEIAGEWGKISSKRCIGIRKPQLMGTRPQRFRVKRYSVKLITT